MLPTRLLDYRRTREGRLVPTWLGASDEVWLRELAAEAAACDGDRVDAADARLLDRVAPLARRHGRSRRVVEAVWSIERRLWQTRVDSPVPPERIRRVLFNLAAERPRLGALATAAAELGMREDEIASCLFADRRGARKLVAPASLRSPAELVTAFNLALVQGLLGRATAIAAIVRANVRSVVAFAKLHGLLTRVEETSDGATQLTVSGPLALFHDTLKYGRALAKWFTSLVATPGWSMEATLVVQGERLRLDLDGTAPLPRTHSLPRAHDSAIEARLERDLRRVASPWKVVREADVVRVGKRLFFPDFTLVRGEARVLVEVVGFWTPQYLAEKVGLLSAIRAPLVMCVDERHATGAFAADPRVITFRKSIDASILLEACERALPRSEHSLVAR